MQVLQFLALCAVVSGHFQQFYRHVSNDQLRRNNFQVEKENDIKKDVKTKAVIIKIFICRKRFPDVRIIMKDKFSINSLVHKIY
jgi:hypothetical protein